MEPQSIGKTGLLSTLMTLVGQHPCAQVHFLPWTKRGPGRHRGYAALALRLGISPRSLQGSSAPLKTPAGLRPTCGTEGARMLLLGPPIEESLAADGGGSPGQWEQERPMGRLWRVRGAYRVGMLVAEATVCQEGSTRLLSIRSPLIRGHGPGRVFGHVYPLALCPRAGDTELVSLSSVGGGGHPEALKGR